MRSIQTQWAVGQGFFHSGELESISGDPLFTYVVDCGTINKAALVRREVAALSGTGHYGDRPLDIAFISHFDNDHVNGIKHLDEITKPRHYVIPETSKIERIHIAALYALRFGADELLEDSWYLGLLEDPTKWLSGLPRERGGQPRVITVRPATEDPADRETVNELRTPAEGASPAWITGDATLPSGAYVAGINHSGNGEPLWVWRTYVTRSARKTLVQFESRLRSLISEYDPDNPHHTIRWVIQNHWGALKNAWRPAKEARNLASLCVYSGPPPGAHVSRRCCSFAYCCCRIGEPTRAPGWLGAGDAELHSDAEAKSFLAAFDDVMQHVGTFAVPHHGAERSWNDALLAPFKCSPRPTAVVGALTGFRKTWQHPSLKVIRATADHGITLRVATDKEASRWRTYTWTGHWSCALRCHAWCAH